jgi:IS5 family transposase
MAHRRIGQEVFRFGARPKRESSLDELGALIDWSDAAQVLSPLYSGPKGEKAWPPLAMFKALLLATWYDLSDVMLAEALSDRASFRRFCGFARDEETPERTAFVRFRRLLVAHGLDRGLFAAIACDLDSKGACVRKGTLIDATVIGSAAKGDKEAAWAKHKSRPPAHGYKAHIAADPRRRDHCGQRGRCLDRSFAHPGSAGRKEFRERNSRRRGLWRSRL